MPFDHNSNKSSVKKVKKTVSHISCDFRYQTFTSVWSTEKKEIQLVKVDDSVLLNCNFLMISFFFIFIYLYWILMPGGYIHDNIFYLPVKTINYYESAEHIFVYFFFFK